MYLLLLLLELREKEMKFLKYFNERNLQGGQPFVKD